MFRMFPSDKLKCALGSPRHETIGQISMGNMLISVCARLVSKTTWGFCGPLDGRRGWVCWASTSRSSRICISAACALHRQKGSPLHHADRLLAAEVTLTITMELVRRSQISSIDVQCLSRVLRLLGRPALHGVHISVAVGAPSRFGRLERDILPRQMNLAFAHGAGDQSVCVCRWSSQIDYSSPERRRR